MSYKRVAKPKLYPSTEGRRENPSAQAKKEPVVPAAVREVLKSPGFPLDAGTRAFMEPRFGHDFGKVRVHADDRAAESARAVNALAYTAGRDIVFAAGRYKPQDDEGKRLIAHELTHVVQQGQHERPAPTSISPATSGEEVEAVQAAQAAPSDSTLISAGMPASSRQCRQEGGATELSNPSLKVTAASTANAGLARQPAPEQQEEKPAEKPEEKPTSLVPKQEAQAEREREVEAVTVGDQVYVLYQKEVRTAGSSTWLANNPGNLDYTEDCVAWGAYEGKKLPWGDHRFAIFPIGKTGEEDEVGLAAVRKFLRKNQRERDIRLMMKMFAPGTDTGNDPDAYAKDVAKALNVPVTTLVKTLSDAQIVTFADKIKEKEGWKVGTTYARGDPSLPEVIRNR